MDHALQNPDHRRARRYWRPTAGRTERFWFGDAIGHADVAVACALRFTRETHPGLFEERRWPALTAHAATCEALEPFQNIVQPFLPPA